MTNPKCPSCESLKLEMKMLYERLADCALRETKLTLEVKVLRETLEALKGTDAGA